MQKIVDNKTIKIYRVLWGTNNVYLLHAHGKNVIIDTGQRLRRKKIVRRLESSPLCKNGIDYLILSHTHFDHCRNASFLNERYQLKLICGKKEAQPLSKGFTILPRGTNYFCDLLSRAGNRFPSWFSYEKINADFLVEGKYTIPEIPDVCIFESPAHSIGSVSILVMDKYLFAGDNLFSKIPNSILPPFADDKKALYSLWKEYLNTKCDLFLPGHGKAISRAFLEKEYRKYAKKFSLK
jgi:glyoxylase-like metal-dependent hydrolase (beta-lactamase superfamily II)